MSFKSDIEIAQACEKKHIREIAATAGVEDGRSIATRMFLSSNTLFSAASASLRTSQLLPALRSSTRTSA